MELTYGQDSKLARVFKDELNLSYEEMCRFLATFYFSSSLGVPASHILNNLKFDSVTTGMMKHHKYQNILKQIEQLCGSDDDESLWMSLEDCFNKHTKKYFLKFRQQEHLYVAIDNDKKEFNYLKHSNIFGLKRH